MTEPALFDLEPEDQADDELDLKPGDDAWTSCRHCQTLTTAAGITNRGHGEGSTTCERYLNWPKDRQ